MVFALNFNFIQLILFMLIQLQPRNAACRDISQGYVHYVLSKYDSCVVVFEGYWLVRQTQGKINLIRFSTTAEVLCEPVSTLNAKKRRFWGLWYPAI